MGQWGELPLNRLKYFYHNTFCWCQFGTLGTEKSIVSLSCLDFSQNAIISNARAFVVMIKMAIWPLLFWKSLTLTAIREPTSVTASPDISPGLLRTTTAEPLRDAAALAVRSCHCSYWRIFCVLSRWWVFWLHVVLSLWHITSLSHLISSSIFDPGGPEITISLRVGFLPTTLALQSSTLRVLNWMLD